MTPWVALLFWAMMVSALLRSGTDSSRVLTAAAKSFWLVQPVSRKALQGRAVALLLAMFASMPLVFLLAVRKDVGTDYASYVEMFDRFRAGEALSWIEPLYAMLNRLAAPLGPSGVVLVFVVSAALAALPLFYRIFRSSPIPWLSVLMLFGFSLPFFMTNGMRSAIAIGIIMLVFPSIWRRQVVVWSLGVLLAGGFHFTALLLWPLYWALHLAWPRMFALAGLVGAIALSSFREIGVGFLKVVDVILPSKYSHYPERVLERLDTYELGLGYLIYVSIAGLVILVWNRSSNDVREVLVFRNASILSLILLIGLYQFWAVNRLGLYLIPALTVFLPWVVQRWVASRERVLWTSGLAILFSAMFVRGLWVGSHQAVPYNWIL